MANALRRQWVQIIVAVLVLALPGAAGARLTFSSIVVFGTSLSDPGNAFTLLTHPPAGLSLASNVSQNHPPYDTLDESLIPSAPYAKGGHHFSNGATWIEQFALGTGLASNVRPAFRSSSGNARNYAVGGARATPFPHRVNLPDQVQAFLHDVNRTAPSDALYVIEIGSNDLFDALAAFFAVYQTTGSQSQALAAANGVVANALTGIAQNMQALYGAGARKFLVWDAPRLERTPAVLALGQNVAFIASKLVDGFNQGLGQQVLSSSALGGLPGIQIAELDVSGQMTTIIKSPGNFGLTDVTDPCITPNTPPFTCRQPDEYFFWDGIHPTKTVHAFIAQNAAETLAQYPGP
ncbi:SGNH/GDSL hydrolase family protein [Burkholderia sp. Ac-20353]|uniref:SGNH/GDSL hydrolase family protein n=1 Tax=Burkholderia sp. Ac-20353 TaxID=2703894 RepID=UPI00197C2A18|nr:SGNH/GDSL hydrolase family protein [Burkholderia sp. Ac-20353]MBN3789469.1 SGNH/GDSL hydrolase family protein [Burkholderia sp. Ac-20353]